MSRPYTRRRGASGSPRRHALLPVFLFALGVAGGASAQERAAKNLRAEAGARDASTLSPALARMTVIADLDDDDMDGRPDGLLDSVSPLARADLVPLDPRLVGATLSVVRGREHLRQVTSGKPVDWGERVTAGTFVQGLSAGEVTLAAHWQNGREAALVVDVFGVTLRDGQRRAVSMATEHVSLERTPPARIDLDDVEQIVDDPDAVRIVVSAPDGANLGPISVDSVNAEGVSFDRLADVRLLPASCSDPADRSLHCLATAPLRFVTDDVDRRHPLVASRSIRAEVGGVIVVRDSKGKKLQAVRVAGPRQTSAGRIERYKTTLRPIVMRVTPGGAPSVGTTDAGAIAAVKQELAVASATWGQCGISFGPSAQLDVKIVNPPPPYLVAFGDDVGLPASGGDVRLRIDGKNVGFTIKKGWSTRQAALELQRVAELAGFKAQISENARISAGASPSVDVALERRDGKLASAELVSSSDATMNVSVGVVDLSDGLQHFGDTDSVAGTLEERALVKSIDDGDPRTIEVIVVPFFGGGGRIGESFIGSDGSSMRNVVIVDRAGIRARRTSLTLAHELGHVILDEPGHPDDFGVDTPTLLMDSDAADASPFGPRRLTNDDCARAVRQSGPGSRLPLLTEWKLGPIKY